MKTMLKYSLILMLLTANFLFADPIINPFSIQSTVLLEFRRNARTPCGSGVVFENYDGKVYIITANHVLDDFPQTNKLFLPKFPKILVTYCGDMYKSDESKIEFDIESLNNNGFLKYDKERDVAVFQIGQIISYNVTYLPQSHYSYKKRGFNSTLTTIVPPQLNTFSNILLGSDVVIVGYPLSLGIGPTPLFNINKPLLRKGIIAGKYEENKRLIIDAPVYYGNSGGPVFSLDNTNRLIGIVTDLIPFEGDAWFNSGYAVAVPVEYAIDLIKLIK